MVSEARMVVTNLVLVDIAQAEWAPKSHVKGVCHYMAGSCKVKLTVYSSGSDAACYIR